MALWAGAGNGYPRGRNGEHTRGKLLRLTSLLCAAALAIAIGPAGPLTAQAGAMLENGAEVTRIKVTHRKSRTIRLNRPFASAVVGATDIADVLPMSDKIIYIQGKKVGTTNVSIFDKDKQLIAVVDVDVTIDTEYIAKNIQASIGNSSIHVTGGNEQVTLTGMAKDAPEAEQAVSITKAMVPTLTVINAIRVAPTQQVMLKVRYLEVDRRTGRDIGINWYGADAKARKGINTGLGSLNQGDRLIRDDTGKIVGPSANYLPLFQAAGTWASGSAAQPFGVAIAHLLGKRGIDVMISALEARGLLRTLAEPDLVALSGDKAKFHVGGEVPVPVIQPSSSGAPVITIEYKKYGVQLEFTPTVLSGGAINLQIAPQVSELDYTNAVISDGYRIPALKQRETRTTVELRDGQSFAISGLLQSSNQRDISQLPWLGTLPVLGTLFRSSSFQQSESDLVVIVTPHLVQPAAPGQELQTPLDQRLPSNDVDFFLMGRLDLRKRYYDFVACGGKIKGPYGHIIPTARN